MPSSVISFQMDKGWKRMARAVDSKRFSAQVRKHVALETRRNAQRAVKAIRKNIKSGDFEKNAPLTIHIKGSSKPLIDNGDLWKALAIDVSAWNQAFVGILKSDRMYDIAAFLHEGGTVRVTDRMRAMFRMLWFVSQGGDPGILTGRARELWERQPGGWYPLKESTTAIRVPGRPFITKVFSDAAFKNEMEAAWERAIERAFKAVTGGG